MTIIKHVFNNRKCPLQIYKLFICFGFKSRGQKVRDVYSLPSLSRVGLPQYCDYKKTIVYSKNAYNYV